MCVEVSPRYGEFLSSEIVKRKTFPFTITEDNKDQIIIDLYWAMFGEAKENKDLVSNHYFLVAIERDED